MSERPELTITDVERKHRYEATTSDGQVAGFVTYRATEAGLVLVHTEVDDSVEGQGIGSTLARAVLDDVREKGLRVIAECPFIKRWIEAHPDYEDLLA
jgi:predicted GNAT family acetyltransferase